MNAVQISLSHWSNHCKEYLAEITGLDPKFGLARRFVSAESRNWSRSGKSGSTCFVATQPGYYEIQEPATGVYGGKDARRWFRLSGSGEVTPVTEREVYAAFGKEVIDPVAVSV